MQLACHKRQIYFYDVEGMKMKKSLAICTSACCQMFTFAYSYAVALAKVDSALLPVMPQPTEWKPAAGECDLATAKVDVGVSAESGLGEEGYAMKIAPDGITVVAGHARRPDTYVPGRERMRLAGDDVDLPSGKEGSELFEREDG